MRQRADEGISAAAPSRLATLGLPHIAPELDHPDLNVRNIAVHGVGNLSMANHGRIALSIARALRQLDPDGTPTALNS